MLNELKKTAFLDRKALFLVLVQTMYLGYTTLMKACLPEPGKR